MANKLAEFALNAKHYYNIIYKNGVHFYSLFCEPNLVNYTNYSVLQNH